MKRILCIGFLVLSSSVVLGAELRGPSLSQYIKTIQCPGCGR